MVYSPDNITVLPVLLSSQNMWKSQLSCNATLLQQRFLAIHVRKRNVLTFYVPDRNHWEVNCISASTITRGFQHIVGMRKSFQRFCELSVVGFTAGRLRVQFAKLSQISHLLYVPQSHPKEMKF